MKTTRPIIKVLIGFGVVVALILAGAVLVALLSPTPAAVPLPDPNGYVELVKAGSLVCSETSDYPDMMEEQLRGTLAKNAAALQAAKKGLSHECRVPVDSSVTNMSGHLTDATNLKRLAQAFMAEGKLSELENRPEEAAESYATTIRLGHECCRGGVMIDSLVGLAIQAMGVSGLEKLAPSLDAGRCKDLAAALEAAESNREPATVVFEQEATWARRTYGWRTPFLRVISFRQTQASRQGYVGRVASAETKARRLSIDLAARAYELENGARPKSLGDLVPTYLKNTPQDPATGGAMNFTP